MPSLLIAYPGIFRIYAFGMVKYILPFDRFTLLWIITACGNGLASKHFTSSKAKEPDNLITLLVRMNIQWRSSHLHLSWRRISLGDLSVMAWWRHQMETFSALLALLCGKFTGHRWIPRTQRPVMRSFDDLFDLSLNRRLSKQPRHHLAHYVVMVMAWCRTGAMQLH